MQRLRATVALITGAGSGIGRQTALRFAEEGATVIAADIDRDAAERTAAKIRDAGAQASALTLDVSDAASVGAAFERIAREQPPLTTLVNNAGVTIVGEVAKLAEPEWDRELAVNLKSIYLTSRAVWPGFLARGGGVILNTASIAGIWAIPNDAAYCASKAAVIMLTKCMALDGAACGIRVNCVCPGYVDTPMIEGYFQAQPDPALARMAATALHPLGRLGRPSDIADAFVYLASDEACWVTGSALVVDGGLTSGIWTSAAGPPPR